MTISFKKYFLVPVAILTFAIFAAPQAQAMEGSWFGVGSSYESISSGFTQGGFSVDMEGGYWYLGNLAYGGYVKGNFFGAANHNAGSDLKIIDLGGFWKAGTDEGLYGKVLLGVAFVNLTGSVPSFREGGGNSLYLGLGGGYSFPISERLQIGPEVLYRHLTAGNGGDQISIGALVTHSF